MKEFCSANKIILELRKNKPINLKKTWKESKLEGFSPWNGFHTPVKKVIVQSPCLQKSLDKSMVVKAKSSFSYKKSVPKIGKTLKKLSKNIQLDEINSEEIRNILAKTRSKNNDSDAILRRNKIQIGIINKERVTDK